MVGKRVGFGSFVVSVHGFESLLRGSRGCRFGPLARRPLRGGPDESQGTGTRLHSGANYVLSVANEPEPCTFLVVGQANWPGFTRRVPAAGSDKSGCGVFLQ